MFCEKNIRYSSAALISVLEEDDKVRLVTAGDGPTLPDLSSAKKLGSLDKVVFTGMIAPGEQPLL